MEIPPFTYAEVDYPLAPSTLYQVGGPAKLALLPRNDREAREAYDWMRRQSLPRLILGGGSNVLIDDAGFPGIVFFTTGLQALESLGDDRYYIGAGVELDRFVQEIMLPNNYEGVGGLTGIPGSVGGAIYMNAGTVNGSTCQLMESVHLLKPDGELTQPMEPELYNYRGQRFCMPGDVILGGTFRCQVTEKDQTAIYNHYIQRRCESQPQGNCCGSVFKNPQGDHAGRLIEACGLKGTRYGGALISPQHANFIMNEQQARFTDILHLIQLAKDTVHEKFGVELEEEVRIIRAPKTEKA